jgi:hypothetical protein
VRLLATVVVLALVVVGAGCGDGDEKAGETTTVEVAKTETNASDDARDAFECDDIVEATQRLGVLASTASGADEAEETAALVEEIIATAPAEIRADVRILADAYAESVDMVAGLELEPGFESEPESIAKLQEAFASLDRPEVTAASERLSTWTTENC